jgi:PLD-like domain
MRLLFPKNGKSTLQQEFDLLCRGTRHAKIAVPFFTHQATIESLLSEGAEVKMIVRLWPITRLDALEKLAANDKVRIKFCIDDWFHTKLYIFDQRAAIFGSANLTKSGLSENHELSAVLTAPSSIQACSAMFDELWDDERLHVFNGEVSARTREFLGQSKFSKRRDEDNVDLAALKKILADIAEVRRNETAEANQQPPLLDAPEAVVPSSYSQVDVMSRPVAEAAMRGFLQNPHCIIETKNYVGAAGTVAQRSIAGIAANATKQLNNAGLIIKNQSGTEHRASKEFIRIIETRSRADAEAIALDRLSLSTATEACTKAWSLK